MSFFKRLVLVVAVALSSLHLSAQEKEPADSLVRLMNADFVQMVKRGWNDYRLATQARFLHNNTYLLCDTAYWYVKDSLIKAFGNVQIIQDETILTSDRLDYRINQNLAQFRGSLVQLTDKSNNTLRTKYLDYNTKDSVATFSRGGAMKDKDGQVIESDDGTYDSKSKTFTFNRRVNMFTDSVFVRSDRIDYLANESKAVFTGGIDVWKDDKMLSARNGWYDRSNETFFFKGNVHMMSEAQEGWTDSMYFYRNSNDFLMLTGSQFMDTTRNVRALGDYIFYVDTLSQLTMKRNASIVFQTEHDGVVDSVYFGADSLVYQTIKRCDVPDSVVSASQTRLAGLDVDPVAEYRQKAAEEAAAAQAAAQAQQEEQSGQQNRSSQRGQQEETPPPALDSLATGALSDTLAVDSLAVDSLAVDSLAVEVPLDTTAIGFLSAIGDVRMFREDMQMRCDSLLYSDLDSLARLFLTPIIWNDGNRQYNADSIIVVIKNGKVDKADLVSNAFIVIQEEEELFDQIKSTEVMAYFDTTMTLKRFDALGGATALFYLKENDAFATVNKVESKMLSANFSNGELERIYYFQSPKNDAYPLVQLPESDKRMQGFAWNPERRPVDRFDVTPFYFKNTQREEYANRPKTEFRQTEIYFEGYIEGVYREMEVRDSLDRVYRRMHALGLDVEQDSLAVSDSSVIILDPVEDTLDIEEKELVLEPEEGDSEEETNLPERSQDIERSPIDSVATVESAPDSLAAAVEEKIPTEKEIRAQKRAEKRAVQEARIQERLDRRNERWEELDARDAAKQALKDGKALTKKRNRTLETILAAEKQAAKDQKKLDRYIKRYEKRYSKRNREK